MNHVIFGFVGLLASGKGTATKYIAKKYNAETFRYSDMLRDITKRLYVEESREHVSKVSNMIREYFGENIMSHVIAEDARQASSNIVVVDGIRRVEDIEHLQKNPNFVLVSIEVPLEIRYKRLIERGENTDDKTRTLEQFKADNKHSSNATIPGVMALATEIVDNSKDEQHLKKQLDSLVKKYTSQ